jgi:hypothetical protein
MNPANDFVVYNMPGILSRRATKLDPLNPSKWIPDEDWEGSVRIEFSALFDFYVRQGLLTRPAPLPEVAKVVLRMSDFSDLGQRFIKTEAPDKWLAASDRPGSKKDPTDVAYLEERLANLKR